MGNYFRNASLQGCYFTQILTCLCSRRHIIPSLSPFWLMSHSYHSFALTLLIYQLFLSTSIRVFFWVKATWDKGLSTLAFPILLFVGIHALECGRGSKHARCLKIVSKCCFNKILCVDVHYMCIFDHLFLPHPKSKWSNFFSLVSYGCLLSTFLFYYQWSTIAQSIIF